MVEEADRPTAPLSEEHLQRLLGIRDVSISLAYSVLRDFQASEDAYQQAALVAHRRISQFTGGRFESWFLSILRNVIGTRIRSSRRNVILNNDALLNRMAVVVAEPASPEPEQKVDFILGCVERLGQPLRRILELRFVQGLPCEDISRQIGRSIQATYAMIKRSRQALRECIELRSQEARRPGVAP
jgi:RNA polymerase sigma-70 factor (ECF subfamily)